MLPLLIIMGLLVIVNHDQSFANPLRLLFFGGIFQVCEIIEAFVRGSFIVFEGIKF